MATSNRIINPAPPSLPLGTDQYERRYQDQFANILRLYFNQLQNALTELFSGVGGKYVAFPYGAFQTLRPKQLQLIQPHCLPCLIQISPTRCRCKQGQR